jgi:protein O-GlcNAc transferase
MALATSCRADRRAAYSMNAALAPLLAAAAARSAAGDTAGALHAYHAALKQAPEHAELWHNVAILEAQRGAVDAAYAALAEAAHHKPAWPEPWQVRGRLLFAEQRFEEALAAFDAALARDANHMAALVNLALTLNRLRRFRAALAPLRRARALAPADETIWWTLRGNLLLLRLDEEALADYLAFAPGASVSARVVVTELASVRRLGDPAREVQAVEGVLNYRFAPGDSALLAEVLALVQYFDVPLAALLALYRSYDALVQGELAASGDATPLASTAPRRLTSTDSRLRIGYLSADFRTHVMGELLAPVIEAHDRQRYCVYLFSLAPTENADSLTARFRAGSDGFVKLASLDDRTAAQAIAAANLDLLVDLMGHSAFARPGILARKPARVIATHLGYHGALGLASVDYKVTDATADVPANAAYQLEGLLPLTCGVLPVKSYEAPARGYDRAALGIARDAVVCAAFVPAQKLSPRCVALWQTILAQAPEAVLLLSPPRDDDRIALVRHLTRLGLDTARVRFAPYEPARLQDRYGLADLALDTLPYSGGDTTASALAAGIPVVTRCGERHAERMSASILRHAGLPELIVDNDAGYVALAVQLITDAKYRVVLQASVRAALSNAALTDPVRYARALEDAFDRALDAKQLRPIM